MDRIIKLIELQDAVAQAYDMIGALPEEGAIDSRLNGTDPGVFGISVMLTDGTEIAKGDTGCGVPLGDIGRIPTVLSLLGQDDKPKELFDCRSCCGRALTPNPRLPVSRCGLRAVSALEPVGDPEGTC